MAGKTLYGKLWDFHVVRTDPHGTALLYIDRRGKWPSASSRPWVLIMEPGCASAGMTSMTTGGDMHAFKLVQTKELDEFTNALKRNGWREENFRIEEEVYDPATAEVEAETGEVIITCTRTHAVVVYHLGRGSSWVMDFIDDLQAGKFGRPSNA